MINSIKQYLNYEIKENKAEYKERLFDNIIDVEEDLFYYCKHLTGHTPVDENDASDTISNFIQDMDIEEVFAKLIQRGIIATDIELETNEGFFSLTTDIYTPTQILQLIKDKNIKKLPEFFILLEELQEQKEYQCEILDFYHEYH